MALLQRQTFMCHVCIINYISTKQTPDCSPSLLPLNELNSTSLSPRLGELVYLTMTFVLLLTHCCQWATVEIYITQSNKLTSVTLTLGSIDGGGIMNTIVMAVVTSDIFGMHFDFWGMVSFDRD